MKLTPIIPCLVMVSNVLSSQSVEVFGQFITPDSQLLVYYPKSDFLNSIDTLELSPSGAYHWQKQIPDGIWSMSIQSNSLFINLVVENGYSLQVSADLTNINRLQETRKIDGAGSWMNNLDNILSDILTDYHWDSGETQLDDKVFSNKIWRHYTQKMKLLDSILISSNLPEIQKEEIRKYHERETHYLGLTGLALFARAKYKDFNSLSIFWDRYIFSKALPLWGHEMQFLRSPQVKSFYTFPLVTYYAKMLETIHNDMRNEPMDWFVTNLVLADLYQENEKKIYAHYAIERDIRDIFQFAEKVEVLKYYMHKYESLFPDGYMHDQYVKLETQVQKYTTIEPGHLMPGNHRLSSLSDASWKWSNLPAKDIYIISWATWCGPCISHFPNYREAYHKLDTSNVEFVFVSLDNKRQEWIDGLNKYQLPGIQLWAGGFESDFAKDFQISGIPRVLKVNAERHIISLEADKELDELVNTLLPKLKKE